jgi:hypothetical protein
VHCTSLYLTNLFPVSHFAINNVQSQNGVFNKYLRTRASLIIKRPNSRIDEATGARGSLHYLLQAFFNLPYCAIHFYRTASTVLISTTTECCIL